MDTDVLVIGSGIAGITAAIEAARCGARTAIASAGPLFSGSSFYPGTWGLGLVGPENADDENDMVETICKVGCGVADRDLVRTFVHDILPAIAWLEDDLGVALKRPESEASARQTAFIPCFDHKRRTWRGITRKSFQRAAMRELTDRKVTALPFFDLIGLPRSPNGSLSHAMFLDMRRNCIEEISAGAYILAGGGTSGLFARRLTSDDVRGTVHGIALEAGASLINMEFMQMMPGFVAPKRGLVFNEKTFRYVCMQAPSGIAPSKLSALLEQRSGHGPFTARLADHAIDLAIDAAGEAGLALRYAFPQHDVPEFVQTFSDWLRTEHGIAPENEFRIALYAHASNGGIRIDKNGWTGVPGLYACGEATGGMHGADRIGGLSSANGLVFGRRCGRAAADCARRAPHAARCAYTTHASGLSPEQADNLRARLRATMSAHAMVARSEEGLRTALAELCRLRCDLHANAGTQDAPSVARALRLRFQLDLAQTMLDAMRARTNSLGSHYRVDT